MSSEDALPGSASFQVGNDTYIVWVPSVTALRSIRPTSFNPQGETAIYSGPTEMMILPLPIGEVAAKIEKERKGYLEWRMKLKKRVKAGQSS